ncbi:MAG: Universal stress protein family [Gaiellales bacterium]|nr:Universal stress protein family [Gaiellales bacterium]
MRRDPTDGPAQGDRPRRRRRPARLGGAGATHGPESARYRGCSRSTSEGRRFMIVVGIDGSDGSTRALRFAAEEARTHALPLRVISTWRAEFPVYAGGFVAPPPVLPSELASATQKEASEQVAAVLDDHPGVASDLVVREGNPARRPAARLGQPAVRPPCELSGRDRPAGRPRLRAAPIQEPSTVRLRYDGAAPPVRTRWRLTAVWTAYHGLSAVPGWGTKSG